MLKKCLRSLQWQQTKRGDRDAFNGCFNSIIEQNGGQTVKIQNAPQVLAVSLFIDQDGNNAVDFSELASGLSVLCGGSRDEKAEAAFALYDYNGDGYISP